MPERKSQRKRQRTSRPSGPRPFWSGTLAFGLVSLPVGLFPAHRGKALSLRMVDQDGTPLARRYFCSREDHTGPLETSDLVRGYPVDDEGRKGRQYVLVEDDELDALAPEKSQQIDLKRFVALDQLDPIRFERAYFLTPEQGAVKAYRLLATAMEEAERAGIATFVMRGKEYLVAILAGGGILRAETLRFHDELRTPEDVGLAAPARPSARNLQRFQSGIKKLMEDDLERDELRDRQSQKVLALARKKIKRGKDVIETGEAAEDDNNRKAPPDLMSVIKQSLKEGHTPGENAKADTKKKSKSDLKSLTKDELYQRAQKLDISGRSGMSKAELVKAIEENRG